MPAFLLMLNVWASELRRHHGHHVALSWSGYPASARVGGETACETGLFFVLVEAES